MDKSVILKMEERREKREKKRTEEKCNSLRVLITTSPAAVCIHPLVCVRAGRYSAHRPPV